MIIHFYSRLSTIIAKKLNWADDVAPVSGDYLVFAGSTRTSVVNNYAPETPTFKMIVRSSGSLHCYSMLKLGGGYYWQTDYNVSHFYATSNEWSYLVLHANGAVCHATNTLAPSRVSLGQIYQSITFASWIDLNGYDQTIAQLEMVRRSRSPQESMRLSPNFHITIYVMHRVRMAAWAALC